jgi:O-succinylbenzoate synthase
VGSVPKDLAIRHRDNRTLTDSEFAEYRSASNPDMVKRSRNYVTPVFNSKEEAIAFAAESGFSI